MRASYTNHGCEGVTHLPVDDGHLDDVPRLVEHEVVVPGVAVLQTPEAKKRTILPTVQTYSTALFVT